MIGFSSADRLNARLGEPAKSEAHVSPLAAGAAGGNAASARTLFARASTRRYLVESSISRLKT